ncbi:hypothetical protein FHR83_001762 [Actinoplanes campanulatus]|uniref:DUF4878 domain-containing protein n=1 Tax=Actinoplanes campanulatus TaxID=113559 RepID=A0A7W5ADN1_9ACTN|nr:hypothetical protein [Actinoplanes campanulatus]MBB3094110.1 hypothetical protein [Actinoplanes campanulatus]GGN43576.1 hypothetical protein GCM10010109_75930 [Actinoplanes campanulatus]GID42284.1 hypothetical protein Aca09nite_87900 [Actinoplanes campanulatus]
MVKPTTIADVLGEFKGGIITGLVLLMCCCGVSTLVALQLVKEQRDRPGVRAASEAYLTAVVSRDYRAAYDLLCEDDRRNQPMATWKPVQDAITEPTGFRITKVDTEGDSWTVYTTTAEITRPGSPTEEALFNLKKQDGDWRVCNPPKL